MDLAVINKQLYTVGVPLVYFRSLCQLPAHSASCPLVLYSCDTWPHEADRQLSPDSLVAELALIISTSSWISFSLSSQLLGTDFQLAYLVDW